MFPKPSFPYPVEPPDIDPDGGSLHTCTFSKEWLPFVLGSLSQLLLGSTWRTEQIAINTTLGRVADLVSLIARDVNVSIQFQQVDCVLQYSVDGGETWVNAADFTNCALGAANDVIQTMFDEGTLSGGGQQPPTPRPTEVVCRTYNVTLYANGMWLCPIPLYAGDSIEVKAASGGTWDGGSVNWFCPDGGEYILGQCAGSPAFVGTDPMPSVAHMRVIGFDGTAYHDMYLQKHTLANTVQEFRLQVNDDQLSNNVGSINLKIEVCTNEYVGDCYNMAALYDLTQSDQCAEGNDRPWHVTGTMLRFNEPPDPGIGRLLLIDLRDVNGDWPNKTGPWRVKVNVTNNVGLYCQSTRTYPPCHPDQELVASAPISSSTWFDIPASKFYLAFASDNNAQGDMLTLCIE